VDASSAQRKEIAHLIQNHGLEITGFHALLYTRPDLQFFESRASLARTVDYLKRLIKLCAEMGGKVLVFGSPKNRVRAGRDYAECMAWAVEGFAETAKEAGQCGIMFCIEPLAPSETEFIQSSDEGMQLVSLVDHPSFGLHLDAKAMIGSRENIKEVLGKYGRHVRHFHAGDPGLAPPGSTGVDHAEFGRALREAGYEGYVSIEMRRGFGPTREVVARSVSYVKQCYLNIA
jgi:sugar phosphate isomerase/epimerase